MQEIKKKKAGKISRNKVQRLNPRGLSLFLFYREMNRPHRREGVKKRRLRRF
jgi:hypothetical protein